MPANDFKFKIYQRQLSKFEEQDIYIVSEYFPTHHLAAVVGKIEIMQWRNWPGLNQVIKMNYNQQTSWTSLDAIPREGHKITCLEF